MAVPENAARMSLALAGLGLMGQPGSVLCEGWMLKKRRKKMQGAGPFCFSSVDTAHIRGTSQGLPGVTSNSTSPDCLNMHSTQTNLHGITFSFKPPQSVQLRATGTSTSTRPTLPSTSNV
jgi:hypothetical protein